MAKRFLEKSTILAFSCRATSKTSGGTSVNCCIVTTKQCVLRNLNLLQKRFKIHYFIRVKFIYIWYFDKITYLSGNIESSLGLVSDERGLFKPSPPILVELFDCRVFVLESEESIECSEDWLVARPRKTRKIRWVPHWRISLRILRIGFPSTCKLTKCAKADSELGKWVRALFEISNLTRPCSKQIPSDICLMRLSRRSSIFKLGSSV